MRLRHLLHLLWIPLALLLALLALYFLAYTPSGLTLIATHLTGRVGPVQIQIQGASGTLAHGAHVERLVIDHHRVHIEIEDASARLAILPLAWQMIRVPEAHAARLLVHALPENQPEKPWQPHFLPALMRIMAERVEVQSWRLIATNGMEFDSSAVSAVGAVYPKSIRIYASALDFHGVQLRGSGEVRAARSLGITGDIHFDAQPQGQPPWTANAHVNGDLERLQLAARFSEPFAADFQGEVLDLTTHWHWQGHSQLTRLDLTAWKLGSALGLISGPLTLKGDRTGFRAQGALSAPGLHAGALETDFAGSYSAPVLTVEHFRLHHPGSGASASAQGTVTIATGGPQLELSGDWSQFRWPLARAQPVVSSDSGHYTLSGQRLFDIHFDGPLRSPVLPPMTILAAHGQLGAEGVSITEASLSSLGAQGQCSAEAHWGTSHSWRVQGHIADLQLAQWRAGFEGRLNFMLAVAGNGYQSSDALELQLSELSGEVRGQRAEGHAKLLRQNDNWQFQDVRLQLGATRLALDGHAGTPLDLNFTLDADDLGLLQAGAHGHLQAHGTVRGDPHDMTLSTTARVRDLDWGGVRLDTLDASVAFDPHGSGRNDSDIQLTGLTIANRRLERLTLHVTGTTAQHSVDFNARAEGLELALHGAGHYAAGLWQEQIERVELSDQAQLHMSLETPVPIAIAFDRLDLESACLRGETARLCGGATLGPQQSHASVRASNLPLRTLTAGLTAATDYDGTLSVQLDASASASSPWRGGLEAHLAHAAIHKHFANGRSETLNLGDGSVLAELSEQDLTASLALDAAAAGRIDGHLSAHGETALWRDWPLTGELKLDTDALGYIDSYVSLIDRASGRLRAQLALAGTAAAPQLSGEVNVTGAQLDAYQINLSLRELSFHARLADNTLQLQGAANCGPDGHAQVDGSVSWRDGLPFGSLHLIGTDLRIINVPEARVDASPDVTLLLQGQRIEVHGQVALPYARIEPANLTNAVLPSSDEVIVGTQAVAASSPFKVYSDLTLQLGERVTVNTAGLSGRLSGSITVKTDDSGIGRGSGELKVEEGKYLAYGRNLDVQSGRLLFSNGLLGDPGLELRAVKKFPDITAGIIVRGTLRAPRMTFFSEPEVAQSQIVSLLLAGGSLENIQNTTATADPTTRSNNASRADLLQGGAILAQQVGGKYNIEAGVEQDLDNQTSLVLGRYLSPRLYISYGVGLAEAINTIKMRYTIGDHWTVKTEAGTQRSADLVFTIEK
jgi:translocation and assembly module TamB